MGIKQYDEDLYDIKSKSTTTFSQIMMMLTNNFLIYRTIEITHLH